MILVPYLNTIEPECELGLKQLESSGIKVWRRGGCSAIDIARNEMVSYAVRENLESVLFIDSDIGFRPADAIKLLDRPEPVVCGVYSKKGTAELTSVFDCKFENVKKGNDYPLYYAATGFLRIKTFVLEQMIKDLQLPLCNTQWGLGFWPFFLPMIVSNGNDNHYLSEDWAFSKRLRQIGIIPIAVTSIQLQHWGRHGFTW